MSLSRTFLVFLTLACASILACGAAAFHGNEALSILFALHGAAMGLSAMIVAATEPLEAKTF